jgi:hypothetical protein
LDVTVLNISGIPDAQGILPKIIGGGSNRLFKVESGGKLVVAFLNLTGGDVSADGNTGFGGAVFLDGGKLIVSHSGIWGNRAKWGGGIYGKNGSITLSKSFLSWNVATTKNGGGAWLSPTTSLLVEACSIERNAAEEYGGGFMCYGQCAVDDTLVQQNTALYGAGINVYKGNLNISHSIIQFNGDANTKRGGGLYCYGNNDHPGK